MATLKVPIVKAKSFIDVNTDDVAEGGDLPASVFQEALLLGLKVIYNRGTTKLTKEAYPDENELKAAAMAKAEEIHQNVRAGTIKLSGGAKANKVSGAVMTEARRLARLAVKDTMKAKGIKVSYVEAKDITAAANSLLALDPSIIEQAKANIETRSVSKIAIDVSAIPISEKKKAAAEKAKAAKKSTLSAAKAGKVAKHKPQAQAAH